MMGSLVYWTWLTKNSECEGMTIEASKIEQQREERLKKPQYNIQTMREKV